MKKNILNLIVIVCFSFSHLVLAEEVIVVDTVLPVINLIGQTEITLNVDEPYVEAGATAQDDVDGDLTAAITIINNVDVSKSGVYINTYNVLDQALNPAVEVSRKITVKALPLLESITIRNGENIIYDGLIDLPAEGLINVPDLTGVNHQIPARSVLALLYNLDQQTDNFSLSNLDYSSSFDSLYLKCLTIDGGETLCDNWQYIVNNEYPYVGMDKNILNGQEKIYLYFGPQNKVSLSASDLVTNEVLTVNAFKYDYEHNLWLSRMGVTIGLTVPDPNNPWSPNDNIQLMVDEFGQAQFKDIPSGIYNVGVKEDYYWPIEKLFVKAPTSSSGSTASLVKTFSMPNALDFLRKQMVAGGFSNLMYGNWVAIGLAATTEEDLKSQMVTYLKNQSFDSGILTDNERQAMALMALGINPYSGTKVNYIKKITDSFDGQQFGSPDQINDDIFGLIVLNNAGYDQMDKIIVNDVAYLISKMESDILTGLDLTAAAIQALSPYQSLPGVSSAITSATNYLVSKQETDFGFGNVDTSSWVLQALVDNQSIRQVKDYLANHQEADGGLAGLTLDSRIWSTAYALPAILGKPWDQILSKFSKPELQAEVIEPILEIEKVEETIEPVKIAEPDILKATEKVPKIIKNFKQNIKNGIINSMQQIEINSQLAQAGQLDLIEAKPSAWFHFWAQFKALFSSLWQHLFV